MVKNKKNLETVNRENFHRECEIIRDGIMANIAEYAVKKGICYEAALSRAQERYVPMCLELKQRAA